MATIFVVVVDVQTYETNEMPLAEDHDMLEQLSTTTQDPALGDSVLPGTPIRGTNGIDAECSDELDDAPAEDGVTVEDEIPRRGVVRERLTELLHHPGRRRMERGVEVNDMSTLMLDDEDAE